MNADDLLKRTLRYLQKTDAVNTLAEDIEKYLAEPRKLMTEEEMRQKLHIAAQVFRAYQAHHEYKGDGDKAERNKGYADQMEAAIKLLEEE